MNNNTITQVMIQFREIYGMNIIYNNHFIVRIILHIINIKKQQIQYLAL